MDIGGGCDIYFSAHCTYRCSLDFYKSVLRDFSFPRNLLVTWNFSFFFEENYGTPKEGMPELLLHYRDILQRVLQEATMAKRTGKKTKEAKSYTGKKLLQATSFRLSAEEEHLFAHRARSSLHLLEIMRFSSSNCRNTLAFLHFQIFQRTQVITVLLILRLFSGKKVYCP